MNNLLSPKLILLVLISFIGVGAAFGQDNPPDSTRVPFGERPQVKRPNLLRILGLSQSQMQQVRRMNQGRKPLMDAAMLKLRDANRALDETIYADNVDESAFQSRLREVQIAQAEVARLRFTGELNIRKILTPDQLGRFRELRRKFAPPSDDPGPRGSDDKNPFPQRVLRRIP